jgi:dipeptidyl aminopeptidase/acylaminoacyl peptidase
VPDDTLPGASDAATAVRVDAPQRGARRISQSLPGAAALFVANDSAEGTRLWLARPNVAPVLLWRGNAWVREVRTGRAQAIAYTSTDGRPLTGWLLLPPGHVPGTRVPIVTVVYPGTLLDAGAPPASFSLLAEHFQHPQLFAALGFGVLVPSMPESTAPLMGDAVGALPNGVLPLLDTLIARGIADSARIALLGQSAGGWATLGLVTMTTRFRTAIASASYGDLLSLYGTFTGQHRHGDGGHPQAGQLSRMLQLERGWFGAGAPPWAAPHRYLDNSPLLRVQHVRTPVMLVHGELDFIPVQQAEEFFTALYRQDKRVRLVRYQGEWHTIAARANVVDLWERMDGWLRETMEMR